MDCSDIYGINLLHGSVGVKLTKPRLKYWRVRRSCGQAGREFHCGLMAKT